MFLSTSILIFLNTLVSLVITHPLNLLHSHHHHHTHHHPHLRLPFRHIAAKSAFQLQHPVSGIPTPALDISDVFVNMTIRTSENSAPSSFLIPLRPSSPQIKLISSVFHHPRSARISNVQYGTAPKDSSRQFELSEEVTCYAHVQPTSVLSRRRNAQRKQPPHPNLKPFRLGDGEVSFAEAGGRWFAADGQVTGFDCVLKS